MESIKFAKNNWKGILFSGVVVTTSITYLTYSYFHKTYPQFVSLPGPFKQIGVSYHRIPNNTRFKLYYPTSSSNLKQSNSKPPTTYFKDRKCTNTLSKTLGIPTFIFNTLNDLIKAKNPMPCFENAPINKESNHKYPLLLFSHGNFAGFDIYTQLLCSLASYGIIIAIVEHTDGSALFTKTYENKDLYFQPGYLIDKQTGNTYKPNPWNIEHDVADFGNQRLKPIRIPEFIKLYNYLTKYNMNDIKDDRLINVLHSCDMKNLIFGGQSFGGVTCWMASHVIKDNALKCLLLLDPWFGCVDINELKEIKWDYPTYMLSSESWFKQEYRTQLTRIVMNNNMNKNSVWQYAKEFVHYDSSDVPLWGPSWLTRCRKIYTAQEWNDLLSKACASFIADNIVEFKQRLQTDCLQFDNNFMETVKQK